MTIHIRDNIKHIKSKILTFIFRIYMNHTIVQNVIFKSLTIIGIDDQEKPFISINEYKFIPTIIHHQSQVNGCGIAFHFNISLI